MYTRWPLIRSIFGILSALQLKKNAAGAVEMIYCSPGEGAVIHTTCKNWYKRSREGDFKQRILCWEIWRRRTTGSIHWIKSQESDSLYSSCIFINKFWVLRKEQEINSYTKHKLQSSNILLRKIHRALMAQGSKYAHRDINASLSTRWDTISIRFNSAVCSRSSTIYSTVPEAV